MFKLDDDLLRQLGLASLTTEEKNLMLVHMYETLELRVGKKLASDMSDDQLDEFEQFIDADDEAGALEWLERKYPHYREVVASSLEALKAEVKDSAPAILAASERRPLEGEAKIGRQRPAARGSSERESEGDVPTRRGKPKK